jgi:aryl-alcohol dehydrogenase-like predicted oxidoreductase
LGNVADGGEMKRRKLGQLEVSAIGLGAPVYGEMSATDVVPIIERALALGVDFIDSSDVYGYGVHEQLVGEALRGRRQRAIIATKFGNIRKPDGTRSVNGRPDHVRAACEASLRRLGTDVIDLYYIHRIDTAVAIEETVGAMGRLVAEGKVRHLGISEASPATLRRAHATHPMAALQTEYSLWTRDPEGEILDTCAELGIGFVPYGPLGRGFLTGTITDIKALRERDLRKGHPRFQADQLHSNLALAEILKRHAETLRCTPAQLALAWLLHRGEFIVPIPGTRRVTWLEQNAAAADLVLERETVDALDRAFPKGVAAGERYPPEVLRIVGL